MATVIIPEDPSGRVTFCLYSMLVSWQILCNAYNIGVLNMLGYLFTVSVSSSIHILCAQCRIYVYIFIYHLLCLLLKHKLLLYHSDVSVL